MSDLRLFIPIGKVDEVQRLVYGTLTEEVADKSGEIFDYATGKSAVQAWSDEISVASKGKSKGNVRAMHDSIAAGKFTDIVYNDEAKRIEGAAKIVDDGEWEKVLAGVYTGFSIGGSYTRRWQDPENPLLYRFTPKLSEVSLVDNPCVPTATFEYIKADGSVEMRKFTPSHQEDSMDPKALAAAHEALAKGTATDEQKALLKQEADALLKAAQDADAKGEATDEQKALLAKAAEAAKPELVKDGKPVKPKAAPVQKNVWLASDNSEHPSKRDAEVHNLHLEKQAELAPGLAEMNALLKSAEEKAAENDDEDKEGDDEATKVAKAARREKKANDQAEKEAAEKAAADELAKQEKDAADKAAAEAAKATPAKKDAAVPVKKSLYQIGWMADLLSNLQSIKGDVEWEQMWEQDATSELPGKFKALVAQMCEVLVTLVGEETKEMIEDGKVEVLEMAAGLPKGHAAALGKFVTEMKPYEEADIKKPEIKAHIEKFIALKDALEKAGARHSSSDKEKLMAIHKSACDHMDAVDKCMKDMGVIEEDDGDKDAKKMSKVLNDLNAARDEISVVTKIAVNSNETLLKAATVMEGLQKQNAELVSRMDHLERQPAAPKGHVRTISKAQDGEADGETEAEYEAKLGKMTPAERARAEMKKAMSNPKVMPTK